MGLGSVGGNRAPQHPGAIRVTADGYGRVLPAHLAFVEGSATDHEFTYRPIQEQLSPLQGKNILDYGCGPGVLAHQLARGGAASVVGVDISGELIENATRRYPYASSPNLRFQQIVSGDLSRVPGTGHFDAAVCSFVLCLIPDRQEIVGILQGLRSALKPDGTLVITDANWEKSNGADFVSYALPRVDKLESGMPLIAILKGQKGQPDLEVEDYFWSKRDYADMLKDAGFQVRSIDEPVADPKDTRDWLDERRTPPNIIVTATSDRA